jgi:membrane-bound inhibitor of C-type lysozyme
MKRIGYGLVALIALPAFAQDLPPVVTTRYACDRGVMVPATYVNDSETPLVVINVDGSQITLFQEQAASGVRYGWPSDGANYVWWTKGEEATLYWKEAGTETPILSNCKQQS